MPISVSFYTFAKSKNSTKRPGSAAVTYNCNIRDGCGVLEPVLEMTLPQSVNISQYNYMQIPAFNRYYFVTEMKYSNRMWIITGRVDVMASYKVEIGALSRFVYRAASAAVFDPAIIDETTIRKSLTRTSQAAVPTGLLDPASQFANGTFVVGVVSKDATSPGMITYYTLSVSQMAQFRAYLLMMNEDDIAEDWETFGEDPEEEEQPEHGTVKKAAATITNGMVKALLDPFQYIVSCMWFPVPTAGAGGTTIKFGFWDSKIAATALTSFIATMDRSISAPKRADEIGDTPTMPGMYVKAEPYAQLELVYPPFESIPIPSNETSFTGVNTHLTVDFVSGVGILQVFAGIDNQNTLLAQRTAPVGIPFQIAQVATDYISPGDSFGGLLHTAAAVGHGLGRMIGTAIKGEPEGIDAFTGVMQGQLSTAKISGTAGGIAGLAVGRTARLILKYTDVTGVDVANIGRCVCKVLTINSLDGFVQCRAGKLDIPAMDSELTEIENYLEGGFYYE